MIRSNTIQLTCRLILERFTGAAEACGNDPELFNLRKANDLLRLDGILKLVNMNKDQSLSSTVQRHIVELHSYDFINFWASRGFQYSAVADCSPAHSAAELGQGGNRADNGDPDTIVPAPSPHKKLPVFVHEPEYSFNDEYNQLGQGGN